MHFFWILLFFLVGCQGDILEYINGMNLPVVAYSSSKDENKSFFLAKTIQFQADKDANGGKEIKVALVVVYDKEDAYKKIDALTGLKFFEQKHKIKQTYKKEMKIMEWTVSPGKDIAKTKLKEIKHGQVKGAFLFANYTTPGSHKLIIQNQSYLDVKLGSKEFIILNDHANYISGAN